MYYVKESILQYNWHYELCVCVYVTDEYATLKMDDTFYDGHDELYHHAEFGEDRTTRAGCRCENVFFLSRSESGAPCVRGVHSSNKHCAAVY